MQKLLLPVRDVKLPCRNGVGRRPRTETCENWCGPDAMVPCFHQGSIYMKRKIRVWKDQKCICLVDAKTSLTCAGRQTTTFQGTRHRAENANLRKLGWTYRLGTVFAPRQYLYQKEATGIERPDMYSPRRCTNTFYLCGPSNYSVSRDLA